MVDPVWVARVDETLTRLQELVPSAGSLRQVPMDLVAEAVARELCRLGPEVRILTVKSADPTQLLQAVALVAQRWTGVPIRTIRDHAYEGSAIPVS